jgi:hypothetical protein
VWGWLPAEESEYFPDESEEAGGKPGPLWRVKFSEDIVDADFDQRELAQVCQCQQVSFSP